jgi:hypothetical protein
MSHADVPISQYRKRYAFQKSDGYARPGECSLKPNGFGGELQIFADKRCRTFVQLGFDARWNFSTNSVKCLVDESFDPMQRRKPKEFVPVEFAYDA